MNLGQHRARARFLNPGATTNEVTDSEIDALLNEATRDINAKLLLLKKNTKFNIEADKITYSITSDIASDYQIIDKSGLWWYDGSQWKQLDAVTMAHLDEEYRSWRDHESGDIDRYVIEVDLVTMDPPADTSLTSGGWIYYIRKPETMSDDEDYPFHKDGDKNTQISMLEILDPAIQKYVAIYLDRALSKEKRNLLIADYNSDLLQMDAVIKGRPDITNNRRDTKYGGKRWGN